MRDLSPSALHAWLGGPESPPVLLDVREHWEFALAHLDGVLHIPLGELAEALDELPAGQPIVCICHHGVRSRHAGHLLAHAGLGPLYNLRGGLEAWAREVDPTFPTYT